MLAAAKTSTIEGRCHCRRDADHSRAMHYGGFRSETHVTVGETRVRVTDICAMSGVGRFSPFQVTVEKTDGETVSALYLTEAQSVAARDQIRKMWFDAVCIDDDGVGLTEESRRWQKHQLIPNQK